MRLRSKTTMRVNFLIKTIMVLLFVLGALVFFVDITKAANWKADPTLCPTTYSGQKGSSGEVMCGLTGGVAQWYSSSLLFGAVPTVSSSINTGGGTYGGYVVDCDAYDSSAPRCDNSGSFWCSPSSTCNTIHVVTVCKPNVWASAGNASVCSTSPAYDNSKCVSDWLDCDGSLSNGCEVNDGGVCTVNMGGNTVTGTYSGCSCIPDSQHFITGNLAIASTTFDTPLLWGKQYGAGDLINITRNGTATSSFVVFNSGQVAIGHNINVSTTSVAFEVSSTQRGILIPRLGGNPVIGTEGEIYYNSVTHKFVYNNGSNWNDLSGLPSGTAGQILVNNGGENWVTSSVVYINTSTGRVGIGTGSPSSTLHVMGTTTVSQSLVLGYIDPTFGFYGGTIKRFADNAISGVSNDNGLRYEAPATAGFLATLVGTHDFYTSQTVGSNLELVMRIRGNNVSMGTTTANAKLSVQSSGAVDILNLFETSGQEVFTVLENGNVGIGATNPLAKLHLINDGAILATGTLDSGWTGGSLGAGTRLMWIPRKAAFRAGDVSGDQWDTAKIGKYSVAFGVGTEASGLVSAAFGSYSIASGTNSFAVGNASRATRDNAISMGLNTLAQGTESMALGSSIEVYANNSVGIGLTTTWPSYEINQPNTMAIMGGNVGIGTTSPVFKLSLGDDGGIYSAWPNYDPLTGLSGQTVPSFSTSGTLMFWYPRKGAFRAGAIAQAQPGGDAWNDNNIGIISFAAGANNVASATGTFVAGVSNSSTAQYSAIVGGVSNSISGQYGNSFIGGGYMNSIYSRQQSFIGGGYDNSISGSNLSNAFIGGGQGNSILGSTINASFIGGGQNNVVASSYSAIIGGGDNFIDGVYSFIGGGKSNTSSGDYSVVFGENNEVSGNYSFTSGQMNEVSGYNSVAFGNKMNVSGNFSFGINLEPDDEGSVVSLSQERTLAIMGGNVGIGTTTPGLRLTVDGGIYSEGVYGSSEVLSYSGTGTKFIWYPRKSAFRVGSVGYTLGGNYWDDANIGPGSVAMGIDTRATTNTAFAMGYRTEATGNTAVALGLLSVASGNFGSTALGYQNTASGDYGATAIGYVNTASGDRSIALGRNMTVSGNNSFGVNVGVSTVNLSQASTIALVGGNVGIGTTSPQSLLDVSGNNVAIRVSDSRSSNLASASLIFMRGVSTTFGGDNYSDWEIKNYSGNLSFIAGRDENNTTSLFLHNNGNVGINNASPLAQLHISGDGAILATGTYNSGWNGGNLGAGSRMVWIPEKAAFRAGYINGTQWDSGSVGDYSVAFGSNNTASGTYSFVAGKTNLAYGNSDIVMGGVNFASGTNANAAIGYGNEVINGAWGSFAIGASNVVSTTGSGHLFALGNSNTVTSTGGGGAIGYINKIGGDRSYALGNYSKIYGDRSFAFGTSFNGTNAIEINGSESFAFGDGIVLSSDADNSMGINLKGVTKAGILNISGNNSLGIKLGSGTSNYITTDNVLAIMDGEVGIGDANPTYLLDVYRSADSGITARIRDSDGSCTLNPAAGASWSCSSDERLKREIANINKGLKEILAIRPINYYWKNNSADSLYKTGFVAQELQEVIPEAVFIEDQTEFFTVSETVLIPILTKAIQEQQIEIENLRATVSTTLNILQSGGQLTYEDGDLDLQNYALLNVKNISGANDKWTIDENGQFITKIKTSDGNTKEMFAMQSPYSEFVFSSSSELINGEAIINFDSNTCELIDENQPLKVNITLTGECGGIFVKEKTATGFVVKELNGGTSTSTFDWMVIAKRKIVTTTSEFIPEIPAEESPVVESTTTPEVPVEPVVEESTTTPEIIPEPPIEESTTTPEITPEPPVEESTTTP